MVSEKCKRAVDLQAHGNVAVFLGRRFSANQLQHLSYMETTADQLVAEHRAADTSFQRRQQQLQRHQQQRLSPAAEVAREVAAGRSSAGHSPLCQLEREECQQLRSRNESVYRQRVKFGRSAEILEQVAQGKVATAAMPSTVVAIAKTNGNSSHQLCSAKEPKSKQSSRFGESVATSAPQDANDFLSRMQTMSKPIVVHINKRVLRDLDHCQSVKEPSFDEFANSPWSIRLHVWCRFFDSVTTVIIRNRADARLKAIRQYFQQ